MEEVLVIYGTGRLEKFLRVNTIGWGWSLPVKQTHEFY
jgi:hypothetical protein